jgi:hypothetical protein
MKFKSTLGNVFFGKESENLSEEKPVDRPSEEKPVDKLSGEKPNEQPHPKPKPKSIKFHCGYCGRDGHKGEFCFKKRLEERMAKEWANKDMYHPSHVRHCPGVRPLFAQFRLGEKRVLWEEGTLL